MTACIPWLIAGFSLGAFLLFWFRDVRRILREKKSMVESAASQLAAHRKKAAADRTDPDAAAVLARSNRIYRQAVDIYNQTLKRPWVRFPAFLMGYEAFR